MRAVRIALIGDYDPAGKAHQGIPKALTLAGEAGGSPVEWEWIHTSTLQADPSRQLDAFQAVWCVPGSPYANADGVIATIRMARTTGRVFLGTCGGFQHAMLEYAEAVWGVREPAHAEVDPDHPAPVITHLSCSLVEQHGEIYFKEGSRLAEIYGRPVATEGYHCRYGLSPDYAAHLARGPLRASGRDSTGDVRAIELEGHPFFLATLYQPERSGLEGRSHPLITAFVTAARRQG